MKTLHSTEPLDFRSDSRLQIAGLFWSIRPCSYQLNILIFIGMLYCCPLVYAQNSLSLCHSIYNKMNASLPAKIDFLTKLDATSCALDNGKVYFQYHHVISDPKALPKDIKAKSKNSAKALHCKNEEFRNALKFFSFDFYYVDFANRPIFSFTIDQRDC